MARLGSRVYDRENPALIALNDIYGTNTAARVWLETQVNAYTTSVNERDRTALDTVPIFVANFVNEIGRYKILEIMLFFSRLVAGRYKAYGRFEPRQIAEAWKSFLVERENEMDEFQKQQSMRQRDEFFDHLGDYITLPEWRSFKYFAQAGYSLDFFRAYVAWLATWHDGTFVPPLHEPNTDPDAPTTR